MSTSLTKASRRARRRDTVMVAYPHGVIEPRFHRSMCSLLMYDASNNRRIIDGAHLQIHTTNLPLARNQMVHEFLRQPIDWLWMVDADQTFNMDILDQMMARAHPTERPIVGALVHSLDVNNPDQRAWPTLWTFAGDGLPQRWMTAPRNKLFQVDATGTGCILFHRSAFEKIAATVDPKNPDGKTFAETSWPWFKFDEWEYQGRPDIMGEDLTFMIRAKLAGVPVHVDTAIQAGHIKPLDINQQWHFNDMPFEHRLPETYVVIPVRDRLDLTRNLLNQLRDQGDYAGIFVYDNGSDANTKAWLAKQDIAEVFDAEGMSIHAMWNAGIAEAISRWPKANVAILNNDLRLGDRFLDGLEDALRGARDDRLVAVAPNYDGRSFVGDIDGVRGICANRYDGTGGFPGFAFMVKGEAFAAGLPMFDEQFEYWFGDNDWLLELDELGAIYGIVRDVAVEHLDGGSQTDRMFADETAPKKARDQQRFRAKWEPRGLRFEAPKVIDLPPMGARAEGQGATCR